MPRYSPRMAHGSSRMLRASMGLFTRAHELSDSYSLMEIRYTSHQKQSYIIKQCSWHCVVVVRFLVLDQKTHNHYTISANRIAARSHNKADLKSYQERISSSPKTLSPLQHCKGLRVFGLLHKTIYTPFGS